MEVILFELGSLKILIFEPYHSAFFSFPYIFPRVNSVIVKTHEPTKRTWNRVPNKFTDRSDMLHRVTEVNLQIPQPTGQ